MKFVAISDTHNVINLDKLYIPPGDVLIHAGDATSMGSQKEVSRFIKEFSALPHTHKIYIGGNHDFDVETLEPWFRNEVGSKFIYLKDETVVINKIKIHGSPWVPSLPGWAFHLDEGDFEANNEVYDKIPEDVDILITHGPPYAIMDRTKFGSPHYGSEAMYDRYKNGRLKPKYHVFGHVHTANGTCKMYETTFVSAAICDEKYEPTQKARVFEL